jgi:hypothetical protein
VTGSLPPATVARSEWLAARPFPHIVVHAFLDSVIAAIVADGFPAPDSTVWHTFGGDLEAGKQEASAQHGGVGVEALHRALAGDGFVGWLRAVSGIPDLIPDPTRHGGGIHQSGPGARLGMHVDFNLHPTAVPNLVRAVNVIVFVGDERRWPIDRGGMLELGEDRDVGIEPRAGLLVVFEASDTSWHGHPTPMSVDAPLRRSVPAYYYRPVREGEMIEEHSTRFLTIERALR